jgi:hypothetical protein
METMNEYWQNRLLIVGAAGKLKAFDRTETTPEATDFALLEHAPTRRVWQFVTEASALKSLCSLSRLWPDLTFFLHYDCEDCHLLGLVRAKNGRIRQFRCKY